MRNLLIKHFLKSALLLVLIFDSSFKINSYGQNFGKITNNTVSAILPTDSQLIKRNGKWQYATAAVIMPIAIIDFSTGASVTGFSSLTNNVCVYIKTGLMVVVYINFAGVSNATTISFTLPFASANLTGGVSQQFCMAISKDNSSGVIVPADSKVLVNNNSTLAQCFKTTSSGAWTASGTKQISGTFTYICQ